jgi:RNA polymerase primary sigma factor
MAISTAPQFADFSNHAVSPSTPLPIKQETMLSRYFRDVAPLPVLKPQQEFEMARQVEETERAVWSELLAYPQLVEALLGLLESRLELPAKELGLLRRRAQAVRSRSVVATRSRYEESCKEVAVLVRQEDVDRELLDHVVDELRPLGHGKTGDLFAGAQVNLRGKAVAEHTKSVLALDRAARRARQAFIEANLRLVVTIARRFNFGQLPLHDLIQEGNIGLIKAIGRFDYSRGFRFSTYASWWIRHTITRAMADKGGIVRVPVHMQSTFQKVSRTSRELSSKLGRQPTTEEVCRSAAIDPERVKKMEAHLPKAVLSLDSKINDDDDDQRCFIELMPEDEEHDAQDTVGNQQVFDQVRQLWTDLKPIEADVLSKRFGLKGEREHTLVEIGSNYDLSRERIRQIQEQALTKIRKALVQRKAL